MFEILTFSKKWTSMGCWFVGTKHLKETKSGWIPVELLFELRRRRRWMRSHCLHFRNHFVQGWLPLYQSWMRNHFLVVHLWLPKLFCNELVQLTKNECWNNKKRNENVYLLLLTLSWILRRMICWYMEMKQF